MSTPVYVPPRRRQAEKPRSVLTGFPTFLGPRIGGEIGSARREWEKRGDISQELTRQRHLWENQKRDLEDRREALALPIRGGGLENLTERGAEFAAVDAAVKLLENVLKRQGPEHTRGVVEFDTAKRFLDAQWGEYLSLRTAIEEFEATGSSFAFRQDQSRTYERTLTRIRELVGAPKEE